MRVYWRYHRVESGETLSEIARRYHTTASAIAEANNLQGDDLAQDSRLIIPGLSGKIRLQRGGRQRHPRPALQHAAYALQGPPRRHDFVGRRRVWNLCRQASPMEPLQRQRAARGTDFDDLQAVLGSHREAAGGLRQSRCGAGRERLVLIRNTPCTPRRKEPARETAEARPGKKPRPRKKNRRGMIPQNRRRLIPPKPRQTESQSTASKVEFPEIEAP